MKKRLKGKVTQIIKDQEYRIYVYYPYDKASKTYPKKRHIFHGTEDEANVYLRDWLHELENPEKEYAQETVSQWLDFWLENDAKVLLKWEQNTRARKVQIIDNNINPHIGGILLPDLDADAILKMYSALKKEDGLAERTLRHIHTTLNQSLNHAVKRKKIPVNPAQGLTPALSLDDDKDNWVVLNQKQLIKFLDNIKGHALYILIFVAAYTGARQSELLGLTWDKILWKKKAIRIEQALHRDDSEAGFELRPRTKRRGSKRTIDVSDKVIELLKELRKRQEENGYKGNHVFVKTDGNFYDASILSRSFKRLTKKYGHEGMTFHHLRHTHATILLSEGAYINEVAARLGHTDSRTTFALYGHVMPGREATLAQFFDKIMSPKPVPKTRLKKNHKYVLQGIKRWSEEDKNTAE